MSTGQRRVGLPKLFVLLATTAHADGFAGECGARRAFIDLGANDGQSLRWFERTLAARSAFTSVTAFEMNSAFEPALRAILTRLPGGTLQRAAAWSAQAPSNQRSLGAQPSWLTLSPQLVTAR
jgi:hypothetical protein